MGVKNFIRIGTCGGLNEKVKVRDVVLGVAASTDSAMNAGTFGRYHYAPHADFDLLRKAADLADARKMKFHAGGIVSSDVFFMSKAAPKATSLAGPRHFGRGDGSRSALHFGRKI